MSTPARGSMGGHRARLLLHGTSSGALFGLLHASNLWTAHAPVPPSTLLTMIACYAILGVLLGALSVVLAHLHVPLGVATASLGPALAYAAIFGAPYSQAWASPVENLVDVALAVGILALSTLLFVRVPRQSAISFPVLVVTAVISITLVLIANTRVAAHLGPGLSPGASATVTAALYGSVLFAALAGAATARVLSHSLPAGRAMTMAVLIVSAILLLEIPEALVQAPPDGTPSGASEARRGTSSPDIVFISLDTVRRDRVSVYATDLDTTPNLERFAREALVFENAVSTSPWTLPSHMSLFTGLYPSQQRPEEGVREAGGYPIPSGVETVSETLSRAGYRCGGFVANSGYLSPFYGFARGFERYFFRPPMVRLDPLLYLYMQWRRWPGEPIIQELGVNLTRLAPEITRQALRWLASLGIGQGSDASPNRPPFFLFVNLMEAHHVEYLPFPDGPRWSKEYWRIGDRFEEERERTIRTEGEFDPALREAMFRWYEQEIRYLDLALGEFFDALRERGVYDQALIVVWSDHGELIGENSSFGHRTELLEPLLKVPLLVKLPSKSMESTPVDERRLRGYVQSVDLYRFLLSTAEGGLVPKGDGPVALAEILPTGSRLVPARRDTTGILAAAEVRRYAREASRFPERYDRDLKAIYQAVSEDVVLKFTWASNGNLRLVDLTADPGEETNLVEVRPDQVEVMGEDLVRWQESLPTVVTGSGEEAPEELRAILRSLGYM